MLLCVTEQESKVRLAFEKHIYITFTYTCSVHVNNICLQKIYSFLGEATSTQLSKKNYFDIIIPLCERSSRRYIGITLSVCLSVRLSVQICVRPKTFLWFDMGLPYLAHGCITMRQCVAYIHDPDTTLNFDLKVKFIGFLTCFRVRPITFFDIGLPYFGTWVYHQERM